MNTNTPDSITHAYGECREHFDSYICELQENLRFDPESPKDLLHCMSTFAGFCDSVDEDKNIVFEHFFKPYALAYFRHFKTESKGERASQHSEEGSVPVDGDLIDYVEAAETEEAFWELLREGSANIFYLWSTSVPGRMDFLWQQLCKIQEMMIQLGVLRQQSTHQDAPSPPIGEGLEDF